MPNDKTRELRAILDRIASSRALMDVPALVGEGRELAASVKGAAGRELSTHFDAIAAAQTSTEATMAAADAIQYLDSTVTAADENQAPETPAAAGAPPAPARAARPRTQSRPPAARKRAGGK